MSFDLKDPPIRVLRLSRRPYNCLRRAGIDTVGQLALLSDEQLLGIRELPAQSFAEIKRKVRAYLARLSGELALVTVLSGRLVEQLRQLVGLEGLVYIGNHGLERWEKSKKYVEPRAFQYASAIRNILGRARQELKLPGLLFEEKGITASIHYRSAQDRAAARKRIASLLRDLAREPGLKVLEGRRVVELRPPLDLNKGSALLDLLRKYDVRGVIYAGGDKTDLDAF